MVSNLYFVVISVLVFICALKRVSQPDCFSLKKAIYAHH